MTRRVQFVRDALYEQGGPGKGHKFNSGEVHDFEDDFANRWVRRGDARFLDAEEGFEPLSSAETKKALADAGLEDVTGADEKEEPTKTKARAKK